MAGNRPTVMKITGYLTAAMNVIPLKPFLVEAQATSRALSAYPGEMPWA